MTRKTNTALVFTHPPTYLPAHPPLPRADSTVLRNLGVGFGHSILAYSSTLRGIR